MILKHTFDELTHTYKVDGHYVLSTSDVLDLNGLTPLEQIPIQTLRWACYRGKCIHKAIECYEQNQEWNLDHEFMPYMDGWFAFRDNHAVQIVGEQEKAYVYLHDGTEQAIGATIDLRFLMDGHLYVADLKTIYPLSGKAAKQKHLAWRLQTESYKHVTEIDADFIALSDSICHQHTGAVVESIRRCIVHIHPKLKGGYAFHEFQNDDSLLWDSAVRIAMEKYKAGIQPNRREVDFRESLEAAAAI